MKHLAMFIITGSVLVLVLSMLNPRITEDALVNDSFAYLMEEVPLPAPVTLERATISHKDDLWSYAEYDETRGEFHIIIDPRAPRAEELLVHEYAHCAAWDAFEDHGVEWGEAYARCYRAVKGDIE